MTYQVTQQFMPNFKDLPVMFVPTPAQIASFFGIGDYRRWLARNGLLRAYKNFKSLSIGAQERYFQASRILHAFPTYLGGLGSGQIFVHLQQYLLLVVRYCRLGLYNYLTANKCRVTLWYLT